MDIPEKQCFVKIQYYDKPDWYNALYYMNGKKPTFVRFGTEVPIERIKAWCIRHPNKNERRN